MSLIDFAQRLAEIEARSVRVEQKLNDVSNKLNNVKGPMDQMIADAEALGSSVGRVGGQVIEMVSLAQDNWAPALQGVVWQLYEVQKTAEQTKTVSRDLLDQIVPLIDERMPNFSLWLKKILQDTADGVIPTLEEMQKKIDDFASSVGVAQLNSMYHNDIPGFIIEFRKLMQEIKDGKKPLSDASDLFDKITGKAKETTAATKEAIKSTSGMTSGSKGGSLGSSSSGDTAGSASGISAAGLAAALGSVSGRTK